jgi:hypothetical protein
VETSQPGSLSGGDLVIGNLLSKPDLDWGIYFFSGNPLVFDFYGLLVCLILWRVLPDLIFVFAFSLLLYGLLAVSIVE